MTSTSVYTATGSFPQKEASEHTRSYTVAKMDRDVQCAIHY